jgi:large subunit ribosomal protein L33
MREQVILECTEAVGTSRYFTTKNPKTQKETGKKRLERKKYNSVLKRHTLHREKK